jgi:UDP-N-acetylglucosamine acyltransferase
VTPIGDDVLFMANTHVGHDCTVGDRVVMANCVSVAGHVVIGDGAVLGGLAGVHQHVRIGRGAMIGGLAAVSADVVPYGMVAGERAKLIGLNLVGLKRGGFGKAAINELRAAFDTMFAGEGTMLERVQAVNDRPGENPLVDEIVEFVLGETSRSYTLPPGRRAG